MLYNSEAKTKSVVIDIPTKIKKSSTDFQEIPTVFKKSSDSSQTSRNIEARVQQAVRRSIRLFWIALIGVILMLLGLMFWRLVDNFNVEVKEAEQWNLIREAMKEAVENWGKVNRKFDQVWNFTNKIVDQANYNFQVLQDHVDMLTDLIQRQL